MSKYPVETSDIDGVVQGVNYLLSGPQGLGQNFSGKSFIQNAVFNGNDVEPYTNDSSFLYVAPITTSSAEMLDEITFKYTFSSTQSFPPFTNGQPITSQGFSNNIYNQTFYGAGVVECTVDYVIVRSNVPYTVQTPDTTGTVFFDVTISLTNPGHIVYTDCTATSTVTGPTDKVILSTQITFEVNYVGSFGGTLTVSTEIIRRKLINVGDNNNPKYELLELNSIPVSSEDITPTVGPNSQTFTGILTSYIDTPPIGLYDYTLGISFTCLDNSAVIDSCIGKVRTLTAQVVKQ